MPNPLFSCAQMPHKSLFCRLLLLAAECGLYLVFLFEVTFVSVSLHCPYKTVHRVDKLLLAFVAHFVLLLARFHKRHFFGSTYSLHCKSRTKVSAWHPF